MRAGALELTGIEGEKGGDQGGPELGRHAPLRILESERPLEPRLVETAADQKLDHRHDRERLGQLRGLAEAFGIGEKRLGVRLRRLVIERNRDKEEHEIELDGRP